MIYALDTEFMEDGHTIELLSIGLSCEDGSEFYAQNRNANKSHANDWVREHVLPNLTHQDCVPMGRKTDIGRSKPHCRKQGCPWLYHDQIGEAILRWMTCLADNNPTFITYYGAYDWVVLCQLFGPMVALPDGWPMYTHDLRSLLDIQGLRDVTQPDDMPHHALSDAKWILETYRKYCYWG